MSKPILIVTLGPTGSGKSSLPDKVKTYLNSKGSSSDLKLGWPDTTEHNPELVLVDDLVETSTKYKSEVFKILKAHLNPDSSSNTQTEITMEEYKKLFFGKEAKANAAIAFKYFELDDKKNIQKLMSLINSPSIEVSQNFTKAYFDARDFFECRKDNTIGNPPPTWLEIPVERNCESNPPKGSPKQSYMSENCNKKISEIDKVCSKVSDDNFQKYIDNKNNIVFETTGLSFPFWLFDVFGTQLKDYKIVFAWSFVTLKDNNLENRIKTRAKANLVDFYIKNKQLFTQKSTGKSTELVGELVGSGPRLPDVSTLNESVKLINQTFQDLSTIRGFNTDTPDSEVKKEITQMCETCLTYMNEPYNLNSFKNIEYLVFDNSSTSNSIPVYDSALDFDYSYYTMDYITEFPALSAKTPEKKGYIPGDFFHGKYRDHPEDYSFGGGRRTKLRKRKRNRRRTKYKRKKSVKRRIKRNRRKSKKKYN